jgi:xylulokinase
MTALVGIDVGTTGVKAIAISAGGKVLARSERGYPLSTPRPGWSEQDPEDWWRATEAALDELEVEDVVGIGLSGQMHGLVVLDDAERLLRPAILWNDQRTAAECAEIEELVGLERLIELTGNRALTGFTAPKLLWLRRHEPDTYARVRHVLLPKDYVRLRLTGEHAIDAADASGTLLLDVANRRWSDDVLDALELPREWLPSVLESPDVSGLVGVSNRLLHGVPVAAGAGDQPAAALGVGIDRPGPLSVVLGTSGVVLAALPAYHADSEARVHAFCHAVPGTWQAMGVMLSAAGSLQWLHDVAAPSVPFDGLTREAEDWAPGVEGLVFLPYLAGERTPHADPDARGAFAGLQLRHDRGALVRAVLEGVAFGLRDSLELLRALGVEAERGRASGGGARGRLWLKIVASTLGIPLELTAVEEGSAFGAALLGGVAAGVFADVGDAVDRCVRVRDVVEPRPEWSAAYDELYPRYRALYPALRGWG